MAKIQLPTKHLINVINSALGWIKQQSITTTLEFSVDILCSQSQQQEKAIQRFETHPFVSYIKKGCVYVGTEINISYCFLEH